MSLLSLVMIVRDEAALLADFLAHHAPLVEQIVVVDTGSTDASCDIAAEAGAEVIRREWRDDFSRARNAGLAAARGEWILILDADESIAGEEFTGLREFLGAGDPAILIQETINYFPEPSHLEWRPVTGRYPRQERGQTGYFLARRAGIFPNAPDLRFTGRVHETILPAGERAGLPIAACPVPVHHYGYVLSPEVNARRRKRYRRLAEAKYEDSPGDWAAILELATVRLEDGRANEAQGLLEKLQAGPAGLRPVVRGLFLLGRLHREKGNTVAAGNLLSEAIRQDPDFLFGWLELVRCRAQAADWHGASEVLQAAQTRFGAQEPLLAKEALRVQIKTARLGEARATADRLVENFPGWDDLRRLRERLVRLGDSADNAPTDPSDSGKDP